MSKSHFSNSDPEEFKDALSWEDLKIIDPYKKDLPSTTDISQAAKDSIIAANRPTWDEYLSMADKLIDDVKNNPQHPLAYLVNMLSSHREKIAAAIKSTEKPTQSEMDENLALFKKIAKPILPKE